MHHFHFTAFQWEIIKQNYKHNEERKEGKKKKPPPPPKPWARDASSVRRQGWLPYSSEPVNIVWLGSVGRSSPGLLHLLLEITGGNNSLSSAARSAELPCRRLAAWPCETCQLPRASPAPGPPQRLGEGPLVTGGRAWWGRGTAHRVPPHTRWKTASRRAFACPQNWRGEEESLPPSFSAGCFGGTR